MFDKVTLSSVSVVTSLLITTYQPLAKCCISQTIKTGWYSDQFSVTSRPWCCFTSIYFLLAFNSPFSWTSSVTALRTTTCSYSKQAFPVIKGKSDKRDCFENDPELPQSSREVEVKRGQFKDKLAILAMAVKCCRKVGVCCRLFNITPGGKGAIKPNFKNPVLVSGYSRDRDVSGRVRGLTSTTNRRRCFYFHFLTLPSEKSLSPSRQCFR